MNLQANIEQKEPRLFGGITGAILAHSPQTTLLNVVLTMLGQFIAEEYCLVNVAQIHLRQYCTGKLLQHCWAGAHRYTFTRKLAVSNMNGSLIKKRQHFTGYLPHISYLLAMDQHCTGS